jgi:hypothetical protein
MRDKVKRAESKARYREKHKDVIKEKAAKKYLENKDIISEKGKIKRRITPSNELLKKAKQRAKKKGLAFNLTLEDIVVPDTCAILGLKLEIGEDKLHDCSPTIDRIDTSLGYLKNNIQVVSHKANRMKSDASILELKLFAKWVEHTYDH